MNLLDLVRRQPLPEPWAEGEKIPWNDPEFSARMLHEHLSQSHDAASRRSGIIDRHVAWIHGTVLSGQPGRILDLGCGPGLYASRLARLGHECVGIDFAPASISYAREQAQAGDLPCTYHQADIRAAEYGAGYDLAMLIFGEFNVFKSADARAILHKAHAALVKGGRLLLEPHTFVAIRDMEAQPSTWHTAESGLFSDRPHLYLYECFWDGDLQTLTERYFIVDAGTSAVTRHASSMQAYTDEQYYTLLAQCGFGDIQFYPSLTGEADESQAALMAIVARK